MKVVDLSAGLTDGFLTYPGDPPVRILRTQTHSKNGYQLCSLSMGTHSGTHVDLPLHCLKDGMGADTFPLETFIGNAVTVSRPTGEHGKISVSDLEGVDIGRGDILLICTGWSTHVGDPQFFKDFPYIDIPAADYLISKGIKALGCDMPSVDPPTSETPVHHALLGAGIGIVEALVNLEKVVGKRAQFIGFPLHIAGGDGSPVRAVAVLESGDVQREGKEPSR
ncbi:MAG: cyclase family protein [Candidatus Latescibacterota bacterium]